MVSVLGELLELGPAGAETSAQGDLEFNRPVLRMLKVSTPKVSVLF